MTATATRRRPVRRTHLQARFGRVGAALLGLLLEPHGAPMGRYGVELIMDLDVHDQAIIADPEALKRYVAGLVKHIGMKAYGPVWIKHFGHGNPATAGYTVMQPIETSSIVVHLSEGNLTAHLNVFSCQPFSHVAALQFTEAFFRNWRTTYTVLNRS